MAEFFRWFALAALLMVLFGGCIGNNAPKEPAASTLMSTTTEKMTTTSSSIASTTSTTQEKVTTTSTTSTTTSTTTTTTTTTMPEPDKPNPQAVLLSNLTNTGFAASYQGYSFEIGQFTYAYDKSIDGALLHVSRPNSSYIDVSVTTNADSLLDNKILIRFVPEYAKDNAGLQTGAIYVWLNGNYSVKEPNESATTSTGWITIESPSDITYMEDGALNASFMNNAGTDIKIVDILLNETDTDTKCKNILVNGDLQASLAYPVTVKDNESFEITANCSPRDYDTGYYLSIAISYNTAIDNEVFKHKVTGYMEGRVKSYTEHYTP